MPGQWRPASPGGSLLSPAAPSNPPWRQKPGSGARIVSVTSQCAKMLNHFEQAWAKCGLGAICGPFNFLIWPAKLEEIILIANVRKCCISSIYVLGVISIKSAFAFVHFHFKMTSKHMFCTPKTLHQPHCFPTTQKVSPHLI